MTKQARVDHTSACRKAFAGTPDPRMAQLSDAMVRHLHAFVDEVEPSREEWMAACQFLADVGQSKLGGLEEFILLSDVLGVSMLVETINGSPHDDTTEGTVMGPFFVDDMPMARQGADISAGRTEGATPLAIDVRVTDRQGQPIPAAQVDIWQSAADGLYDVQRGLPEGTFELRARFQADEDGRVHCRSVMPIAYQVPTDGPVGDLLRATSRHPWRPAHVHFRITAPSTMPGQPTLTTHLFPTGDPYLGSDAVFGVKPALVIDMPEDGAGGRRLEYTFVIG
ncbi:MAG: dioxygenase [Alteraurantiacibacter sp.]